MEGRYQNGCRYHLRYLISADCKAVRGKGSEVATSDHVFLKVLLVRRNLRHRQSFRRDVALLRLKTENYRNSFHVLSSLPLTSGDVAVQRLYR